MTVPLLPETVCGATELPQTSLPLATEGVQRYVWKMAHGDILVEVRDGVAYVNGQRVEPIAETLERGLPK